MLPVGAGSARDAFRHNATLFAAEAVPTGLRLNPGDTQFAGLEPRRWR